MNFNCSYFGSVVQTRHLALLRVQIRQTHINVRMRRALECRSHTTRVHGRGGKPSSAALHFPGAYINAMIAVIFTNFEERRTEVLCFCS